MKCTRCREGAVIDLRRHNAAFCRECFLHFAREQVRRSIKDHAMFEPGDRILVAVSGGKDSLALWALLRDLGYEADGLYVGLGIGEYSDTSHAHAVRFAEYRNWPLEVVDLRESFGFDIPGAAVATRRAPCGACGSTKRHVFDRVTVDRGYDVLATGHNLDDEAGVLLGNVLRWELDPMRRQAPTLPAHSGFPRKVKPLVRLSERETAAYCVLTDIDYLVEECPMAAGNRHLGYKEMLNALEEQSPGAKAAFLTGFYERGRPALRSETVDELELHPCTECGGPTTAAVCQFCRMRAVSVGVDAEPAAAQAAHRGRARRSRIGRDSGSGERAS